jgi:hypothetical protein
LVTRADYDALQVRLKELHPDNDTPHHDSLNPGVQIAKLHFLRSLTPVDASLPRYPNEDEDDPEIQSPDGDEDNDDPENQLPNSLFPSPLSTLDLSTLELKNVTRRLPSPLLLRQEYEHISKLIEREPRHSAGSVIVSGQPGTGEFLVSLSYRI